MGGVRLSRYKERGDNWNRAFQAVSTTGYYIYMYHHSLPRLNFMLSIRVIEGQTAEKVAATTLHLDMISLAITEYHPSQAARSLKAKSLIISVQIYAISPSIHWYNSINF